MKNVELHRDPTVWGRPLVVLYGVPGVGLTSWFAWRSVRVAAPLAAAVILRSVLHLPRRVDTGLDLPAAAPTMLYLGLGIPAVRRGSFSLGFAAGLVFAGAFLVKELALPFAPESPASSD